MATQQETMIICLPFHEEKLCAPFRDRAVPCLFRDLPRAASHTRAFHGENYAARRHRSARVSLGNNKQTVALNKQTVASTMKTETVALALHELSMPVADQESLADFLTEYFCCR